MFSKGVDRLERAPVVIPDALKLRVPRTAPAATRKEMKFPTESSVYSNVSNNIVRFNFQNTDIIDFSRGGIAFDLTLTAPGATYCRVSQGVWSIFERVRLVHGAEELEDIRENNRLQSLLFEVMREPDVGAVLGHCYGYGTQAQRNAWGATPAKDYMMPIICGLFLSGPIPTEVFKKKLILELYLANWQNCLETDAPGPVTITLTNCYFHYEVLQIPEPLRSTFVSNAMAGGSYPYKSFAYYNQAMVPANQNDLAIPHSSANIDCFINFMINTNDISNPAVNDKFLTWNKNTCTEHTLRINNEFFPIEPAQAQSDPQSYLMFLRWIDKWRIGGIFQNPPTISFDNYNADRFLIIYQMESFPREGLVNQLSTANSGNNTFLRVRFTAAPVNQSLITFVQVSKTIDLVGTNLQK